MLPLPSQVLRVVGWSVAGWLVLGGLRTALRIVAIPRPPAVALGVLTQVLIASAPWLVAAPVIVALASRQPRGGWDRWRIVAVHAGVALAVSVADAAWGWLILPRLGAPILVRPEVFYLFRLDQVAFLYAGLVGLGIALRHRQRLAEAEGRAGRLEMQLLRARLHVLELQLHPHFLFNTLNAVSELVHRDPSASRTMLASLRELLDRALGTDGAQEITLREELALLAHYARIQRARFAGSLEIATEVEDASLEARVPRLVLQPLVENAIRHGTAHRSGPGRVTVRTRVVAQARLLMEVQDDGVGLSGTPRHEGLGLGNTRARLRQLYGDEARLTLEPAAGRGAIARLECPYTTRPDGTSAPAEDVSESAGDELPDAGRPTPPALVAACLALAWFVLSVAGAGKDVVSARLLGRPEAFAALLPDRLVECAAWLVLTAPAVLISARLAASLIGRAPLLLAHLVTAASVIWAHFALVRLLGSPLGANLTAVLLVNDLWVYAALAAGTHAFVIGRAAAARRAAAIRLEAELTEARLEMLRWRLRPDLLFGALDLIGRLASRDPDRADELTGRLGELLRLVLHSGGAELVPLGREVELVKAYVELEGVVRSEPAGVLALVAGAAEEARMPAMLLQPLVEALGGLLVTVTARQRDQLLEVRLSCRGGGGVVQTERLRAVRERLALLYGDACRLQLHDGEQEREAVVRLPIGAPDLRRAVA